MGESFGLHRCRIQSNITDLWTPLITVLRRNLLPRNPRDYHSCKRFDNYSQAIGALDATLIRIRRPVSSTEAREYLSGKHRAYGMRLQVLVAPDGQCIHYGGTINGRRHDFVLYEQSGLANEMLTMVTQSDGSRIPTRPTILADGGYAGIHSSYPEAIIPRRRRPNQHLTEEDREFNRNISHDRVIVERFFGRLKGYWTILEGPLRIDRVNIDGLMIILVCLTNLKIRNQPMFADEPIHRFDPEYEEDTGEESESLGQSVEESLQTPQVWNPPQQPQQQEEGQRGRGARRTLSITGVIRSRSASSRGVKRRPGNE